MSEELFRAKSIRDGSWVLGAYTEHISGRAFIVNAGIDHIGPVAHIVEVDPDTKGQFTGIYDATPWDELTPAEQAVYKPEDWCGRMIFEGDILEAHYDDKYPENATISKVIWYENIEDGHGIGWYMKQGDYPPDPFGFDDGRENRVIGNIHENSDLLRRNLFYAEVL